MATKFLGEEMVPTLPSLLADIWNGEFDEFRAASWAGYHSLETFNTFKLAAFYLTSIFTIQYFMKNRKPFQLKNPLIVWNWFQAAFSLCAVIGTMSELRAVYDREGLNGINCNTDFYAGTAGAWHFIFLLSKITDFVDTFFVVVRKKPLIFLHYYHHTVIMLVGFYGYSYLLPGRLITIVNGVVHTLMYSYYAICSMRIKIPGWVAKSITRLQIVQLLIGVACGVHATVLWIFDSGCHIVSPFQGMLGWFGDFTLLTLFIHFYQTSYVFDGGKSKYRDEVPAEKKKVEKEE